MEPNERQKLQRLYELYEQPMYRIAYAFLHDVPQAEDAVSDAFVKIIGKLHKIGEPDSPKTKGYIVKVIKSTAVSIYRRNKRRSLCEVPVSDDTLQIADPRDCFEKITCSDTEQLLQTVSESDRRILMLRCGCDLPWREIAEKTAMSEANVRKRFERVRKKILKTKGGNNDEN